MGKRIYLCLARMSGMEMNFIQEAIDTNWVVPIGPNVNAFEDELADFVNMRRNSSALTRKVACLSSGTAAIHLALLACGVGPGDEVMVQSFTFCASANPITYLGGTPVFIDSEPESWNMDPDLLEEAIRDRLNKTGKKPKAIIPVSLYGMPYRIDRILEIAANYEIPVIEDSAEGLGSLYRGQSLGTFGEFGVLSFNGNKMITTSGGGALICRDEEIKKRILFYATQARENYPYYYHEQIGYNYRMSNICAGIGRGQMTVLKAHISHHRHVQAMYENLLEDVAGIEIHKNPNADIESNYWLSTIILDPKVKIKGQGVAEHKGPNANVEALRIALDMAGVESRPLWKPMHCQPVYRHVRAYVNGISEHLFKRGLCLPTGPCVTYDDVHHIVNVIKSSVM